MLPGKHGLSFNNSVSIPTADCGRAPSPNCSAPGNDARSLTGR